MSSEQLWRTVKDYYMTLEEWYHDQNLFHLVGFLINEGESILELIRIGQNHRKGAFFDVLKERIWRRIGQDEELRGSTLTEARGAVDEQLGALEYPDPRIKSILLLFNIASIIENERSIVRFRFDYFKKESWDIEHIRSITEQRPRSNIDKKPWLEVVCRYFEHIGDADNLRDEAHEMLYQQDYTDDDAFETLYTKIVGHFGEEEESEAENGIGNLALLDRGTNRGYRNAVFPIKREELLRRDKAGTFVPLCTRNAFLKAYSEKVDKMLYWGQEDQNCYRTVIASTLAGFFSLREK